jgi:hypothetical protein
MMESVMAFLADITIAPLRSKGQCCAFVEAEVQMQKKKQA